MATKKLEVLITGNAKGAQKAFGDLEKSAGKSGKKAETTLQKLNGQLLTFGIGAAVYGAFSAFDDAQKVMAQTEAVLKSTGGAANTTAGEVEGLASALSKKTGIDDEAIQSGENLLLTFTNIRNEVGEGNDVFDQATVAALDMSVALGTDMTSASQTLGKALNDPVAGMSKLTKIGVTFTQQQKDQVRALSDSGDRLGAQKIILAELNKEFGGSAEAQATALGKAKVSFDNMAESIGGALAPALETATGLIGGLADAFSGLPSGLQTTTILAGGGAIAWLKWSDGIKSAAGAAKGGIGSLKAASSAIGDLASSRGVSKGRATLEVLKSSLSSISPGAVAATAGVAGLAAGFAYMQVKADRANKSVESMRELLESGLSNADAVGVQLANTLAETDGAFENLSGSGGAFKKDMEEMGMSAEETAALLSAPADEWQAGMEKIISDGAPTEFLMNLTTMRNQSDKAAESNKTLSETQQALGVTTEQVAAATETAADRTAEYKDKMSALAEQAKEATGRINDFYDATTQTVASQIDVEAALDDVAESFKTNGAAMDIGTDKGRANQQAIIDAKDAQVDYAMELRDTEGTNAAIASMVTYSDRLRDTLIQSGLTEGQTNELIAQMGLTPKDIYTKFGSNATAAEEKTQRLINRFGNVPGWKSTYFNVDTWDALNKIAQLRSMMAGISGQINTAVSTAAGIGADKNALGGPVRAGRLSIVGEYGPELVKWAGNGTVIPAGASSRMMSGMGGGQPAPVYLTVQVQGSVVTERQLVDVVRTGLIDIGRRTGRPVLAGY